MQKDERDFLIAVHGLTEDGSVRELIEGGAMHSNRCLYLLRKWQRKGWYHCDDEFDMGRLTKQGDAEAKNLVRVSDKPEVALHWLLARIVQLSVGQRQVDSITTRCNSPQTPGDAPTGEASAMLTNGTRLWRIYTIEQIQSKGVEELAKTFRHAIREELPNSDTT